MQIPAGKRLILTQDTDQIVDVPMILSEPVTINLSSSFEPLMGDFMNSKWLSAIAGVAKDITGLSIGLTGQFKQMGFQIWKSTDPVSLNLTVTFHVDKTNVDGLTQVKKPALELMKLPIPREGKGGSLIPPGPSVLGGIERAGDVVEKFANLVNKEVSYKFTTYAMAIGKVIYLDSVIVKKAEPTFSIETDEMGYPMWAQVNLDIQSVPTATVEVITQELESQPPSSRVETRGRFIGPGT